MNKKKIIIITSIILVIVISSIIGLSCIFNEIEYKKEQERRKQIVIDYYNSKVALYQEENKTLSNVDIAFIGDSLTDGYDLKKYYSQYNTVNRGIGGDTTFGVEKRLEVSLYDINPKMVVMLIGGNNIYNMFDNYESILQQLKENLPNSKIVLLSLTAMSKDWASRNNQAIINNQKIKSLANKYNYTFVDLFTPLYNVDIGEMYAEYSNDGAHFTEKGFEVVTNTLTPILDELLKN